MRSRPRTAVVTDSTVSLPPDLVEGLPLHVVPLEVTLDGRTYLDGVDLTPQEFYRLLPHLRSSPRTSAPSPGGFLAAFQDAASYAEEVLCITLSACLSSTYDAARTAASTAREAVPGLATHLMDSGTAAGAEGLIALAAARCAGRGAGLEEVKREAEAVAGRVEFLGLLETLHYIWKGGHIPRVALWATSLLNVKPILDIHMGRVRLVERPRTRARAIERLLWLVSRRTHGGPLHTIVMHASAPEEAEALATLLRDRFPCIETLVAPFTPVIGSHTGPGLLGVAFYDEPAASDDALVHSDG